MNKISKDRQKQIDALRERYDAARADLDTEQSNANEAIKTAAEKVNEKIADLNAIIEEANSLREEIESDAQNYYDEKSEAWQDGERGSAYSDFIQSWGEEIETIEDVSIDEIAVVEDVPETLLSDDSYPTEPNY